MPAQFYIDPDIRKAETMPSAFYIDEKYFELSKEKIFARTWQLIATMDDVNSAGKSPQVNVLDGILDEPVVISRGADDTRAAGRLHPVNILEGFLDEPVFISRDAENRLRCISNVCTHRGKIVVEKPCEANLIRCGYHGRRFDLEGNFLSMPEFELTDNFPTEKDNLPKVPFGTWAQFIFASVSPVAALDEFIGEMKGRIAWDYLDKLTRVSAKTYTVGAHWALYCENYLEGFHIPFVHEALNKELDYGAYSTDLFRYGALQTGYDKAGEIAAQYFFIFPNMMFNFYPWGLSLNIVKPVHEGLTDVEYHTFVSEETKIETGAGVDLETVEMEDQAVVESVQQGLRSRFYDRGRYSPTREQGCHHFHRLLAEFMEL
jgi:choline monooxygenase